MIVFLFFHENMFWYSLEVPRFIKKYQLVVFLFLYELLLYSDIRRGMKVKKQKK